MLTRRRFLRDLGTGLLVAAAAPVLVEPERKQWFVSRNAPVPSRARVFDASQVTVRFGGMEHVTKPGALLEVGEPRSPLGRALSGSWKVRVEHGETDAEFRDRVLAGLNGPYLLDKNGVVEFPPASDWQTGDRLSRADAFAPSAYRGPVMRVRLASGREFDVYDDDRASEVPTGALRSGELARMSGGGNVGLLRYYDQTGAGRDLVAVPSHEPTLGKRRG